MNSLGSSFQGTTGVSPGSMATCSRSVKRAQGIAVDMFVVASASFRLLLRSGTEFFDTETPWRPPIMSDRSDRLKVMVQDLGGAPANLAPVVDPDPLSPIP